MTDSLLGGGVRSPADQELLLRNRDLLLSALDRAALARDNKRIELLSLWLGKMTYLIERPGLPLTESARREFTEGAAYLSLSSS